MVAVRDFFIVMFTPLARRLSGVSPNTLTAVSLVTGVAAGVAFSLSRVSPAYYVWAGLLVAISGATDCLDGVVARMFCRVSTAGDFFDHTADRIVEVAILGGIAWSPGANTVLGLCVIILTLLHSYLGAQIQATFGRRPYGGGGKAEQFVGLIVFAAVLAIRPNGSLILGTYEITLANLFFVLLAGLTLTAFLHRLMTSTVPRP